MEAINLIGNMKAPEEKKTNEDGLPYILPDEEASYEVFPASEDKKTLYVPVLQSMRNYTLFHYKRSIVKALEKFLDGEAAKRADGPGDPFRVADMKAGRMDFRGSGRTSLLVQICLRASLVRGTDHCERQFFALLSFDMDRTIRLFDISVSRAEWVMTEELRTCWCDLDEYLIPVLDKKETEKKAEALLYRYNRAGWLNQLVNTPEPLAEGMGLTVLRLPLHNCPKNMSQLFFKAGTLTVDTPTRNEKGETLTEIREIGPDTVVINTNAKLSDDGRLALYHECIHYEWHYMFYLLQELYTDDLRKIRKSRTVLTDRRSKKADALSFLEFQAVYGSFALWMPYQFMKNQLMIRREDYTDLHPGARWQEICRAVARAYNIPASRVRTRFIRMGHIEARGALNWVGSHPALPFSFSREAGSGQTTYFIDPKQYRVLYQKDDAFRTLIDSGEFIYADGHVCVNDPSILTDGLHGLVLTEEASKHVERYCLRFTEIYERNEKYSYQLGRLHYDENYSRHYLVFDPGKADGEVDPGEEIRKNIDMLDKLPDRFGPLLKKLMEARGVTGKKLAERIGVVDKTIYRLLKQRRLQYPPETVLAIIVGLHLNPWLSAKLLKAANLDLTYDPRFMYCSYVVNCMYMDDYDTVREFLTENHVEEFILKDPETSKPRKTAK